MREQDEWVLALAVQTEQALDAFHHPYAYAGSRLVLLTDCSPIPECGNPREDL